MSYNKALEKILFLNIEEKEVKEKEINPNYLSTKTYVIIDAARIKKLTNELVALTSLKYENLFMPYEQEELEEVAPYLIELKKEDDFTQWVYEHVYGKLGAMFIHSTEEIEALAEHFRAFITTTTKVPNPKDATALVETKAYMRLYDPRVFPLFVKQVNKTEFYSPLESVYVENSKNEEELFLYEHDKESILNLKEL